jgi:hypothetical protein
MPMTCRIGVLVSRDSILTGLARWRGKKKSGDDSAVPVPIATGHSPSRKPHRMINILSLNVALVALLTAASAVNGIIFYTYL